MKVLAIAILIFITNTQLIAQAQWNVIYDGASGYHLYTIHFTSNSVGYSAGSLGRIIKTTDAGKTWTPVPSGIKDHIADIFFPSSNVGYAVASNGKIIKTINAGLAWTSLTAPISVGTFQLNDCYFLTDQVGFVVGDNGIIIKTIDGGITWQVQNSGVSTNITSINFITSEIGFALNGPNILKTLDGGLNWNVTYTTTSGFLINLFVTDVNNMYAVGRNIGVKTKNGGTDWTEYNIPDSHLYSVAFINENIGYAVGYDFRITYATIKKTIDGGLTWTTEKTPITNYLFSVTFVNGIGYASASFEVVESIIENITGLKQTSYVNTKSNLIPNPFHFQASLEFETSSSINAECIIFDFTGKEVLRIKNIIFEKFIIDRNNLSNGLYTYHLINNNILITTGKFIIN